MGERKAYFDNAKWFVIIFIIMDHFAVVPLPDWLSAPQFVGRFVVRFSMPVFAIISGYMCRGRDPGKIAKDGITRYLLPYFLVQLLWAVVNEAIGRRQVGILIPNPSMYYLIVLVWWRLLLAGGLAAGARLNLRLSGPVAVGLIMALNLVERIDLNYVNLPDYLGVTMLLVYMPYFFAGYYLREEHLRWLARPWIRVASFAVFWGSIAGLAIYPDAYLTLIKAFNPQGTSLVDQLLFELERLAIVIAALSIIPWNEVVFRLRLSGTRTWTLDMTRLGRFTIYPYMFHAMLLFILADGQRVVDAAFTFVYGGAEPFSVYVLRAWGDWWRCTWTVAASVALFFILSSPPFRRVARYIAEPAWAWRGSGEQ